MWPGRLPTAPSHTDVDASSRVEATGILLRGLHRELRRLLDGGERLVVVLLSHHFDLYAVHFARYMCTVQKIQSSSGTTDRFCNYVSVLN